MVAFRSISFHQPFHGYNSNVDVQSVVCFKCSHLWLEFGNFSLFQTGFIKRGLNHSNEGGLP